MVEQRGDQVKLKVLWVDRVLWPYRRPVWSSLGNDMDLTVAVFDEQEPNRPRWPVEGIPNVDVRRIRTRRMAWGKSSENPVYFGRGISPLIRALRPDVIVLSGWESP